MSTAIFSRLCYQHVGNRALNAECKYLPLAILIVNLELSGMNQLWNCHDFAAEFPFSKIADSEKNGLHHMKTTTSEKRKANYRATNLKNSNQIWLFFSHLISKHRLDLLSALEEFRTRMRNEVHICCTHVIFILINNVQWPKVHQLANYYIIVVDIRFSKIASSEGKTTHHMNQQSPNNYKRFFFINRILIEILIGLEPWAPFPIGQGWVTKQSPKSDLRKSRK